MTDAAASQKFDAFSSLPRINMPIIPKPRGYLLGCFEFLTIKHFHGMFNPSIYSPQRCHAPVTHLWFSNNAQLTQLSWDDNPSDLYLIVTSAQFAINDIDCV